MALVFRLGIFILLLMIAIILGLYLGKVSVSDEPILVSRGETDAAEEIAEEEEGEKKGEEKETVMTPPVFFYPGMTATADWKAVSEEIAMAASNGIHRYVVTITPDWFEEDQTKKTELYNALLGQYLEIDKNASFLVQINLNPSVPFLEAHPESVMRIDGAFKPYPSPASPVWREEAGLVLESVIAALESGIHSQRISGYILSALQGLQWMLPEGYDVSKVNQQGFIEWLRQCYRADDTLQKAWGSDMVTLETALIPAFPETETDEKIFYELPEMQSVVDFLHYSSESVADALMNLTAVAARATKHKSDVIIAAHYGYAYENLPQDCGHFGLELLLESDLNTILSPVSYVGRGLGGVGGPMGPVDSMLVRGKHWFVIDDTRTGVERDVVTGEFASIRGINVDDVYEVQRRNFALTLTYNLGLVWADPQREGWLHDAEQWKHFGQLNSIYAEHQQREAESEQEHYESAVMTVVVDETSRFYVRSGELLDSTLLQQGRDAAMRSGVSLRFHLLRDVIEDIAPATPVYLFLNAFRLSDEDRARLHARLKREQACAIWLYAPGYFDQRSDAELIAKTTGMDVRMFEEPFQTGSNYLLSGQFMHAEEKFGDGSIWAPAFYIEPNEETDFIANYVHASEKGSVAILSLPEGWTSVYIAEPGITPALLCEILQLLEQHRYLMPVDGVFYDTLAARDGIIALHANQPGKRSVYFGNFYDTVDLFDHTIGWPQKDSIMLPMQAGETRLLLQKPVSTQ